MSNHVTVTNLTRGRRIADRVQLADDWGSRLRGLLGRGSLDSGEGLLLVPCRAVHMVGMRFSLDVAFLDATGVVVAVYHNLAPGAHSGWHARAAAALEVPSGTLASTDTREGDALQWDSAREAA